MVGPRGGSPYNNRRGISRIAKQQYYQQALTARQTQAASAAFSAQQQLQVLSAPSSHSSSNGVPRSKSASKDTISLRDTAVVTYVRRREWMELVLGTAVEVATTLVPLPDSIKSGPINAELDLPLDFSEKAEFYKQSIESLERSFPLSVGSKDPHPSEKEFKERFNYVVAPSSVVKKVEGLSYKSFNLPEPRVSPPKEVLDAKIAQHKAEKNAADARASASNSVPNNSAQNMVGDVSVPTLSTTENLASSNKPDLTTANTVTSKPATETQH